jgi:hypothetical protein
MHPRGASVFTLGVLSLALGPICVGMVLGPIAWWEGRKVLAEIDSSPGDCANRRRVVLGRRCGIVATVVLVVVLVVALWASTFTLCCSDPASG